MCRGIYARPEFEFAVCEHSDNQCDDLLCAWSYIFCKILPSRYIRYLTILHECFRDIHSRFHPARQVELKYMICADVMGRLMKWPRSELDESDMLPLTRHVLASRAINHKRRWVLTHCSCDFLIFRKTSLDDSRYSPADHTSDHRSWFSAKFPQVSRVATIVSHAQNPIALCKCGLCTRVTHTLLPPAWL